MESGSFSGVRLAWCLAIAGAFVGQVPVAACGSAEDETALEEENRRRARAAEDAASAAPAASCGAATCSGATPVCDPLDDSCVECLFDTDCGEEERCHERRCEGVVLCTNSLDCVDAANAPICDPVFGACVECLRGADCEGDAECVANTCHAVVRCTNSLDCPSGHVCHREEERCVECVTDADCSGGASCSAGECQEIVPCASDKQCTPLGLLCDRARGVCARCAVHEDCPAEYHCAAGECVLDVCAKGQGRCESNAVSECNTAGDGWTEPTPCGAEQVCAESNRTARCAEQKAAPDAGTDASLGGGAGGMGGEACAAGQKRCLDVCVAPAPIVGCALDTCEPCPEPPDNGIAVCEGSACRVRCNPGHALLANVCLPLGAAGGSGGGAGPGTGGAAGSSAGGSNGSAGIGGSVGGSVGNCDVAMCEGCSVVGPFPCCRSNGTCGCTWTPGGYCL